MNINSKADFVSFSDFCNRHRFEPKRIIMPNNRSGYQYILSETGKGICLFNVNTVTLKDLAVETLKESFFKEGYALAEPLTCIFLILDILNSYKSSLLFFNQIAPDIYMARAIYENLTDLRMACVDLEDSAEKYYYEFGTQKAKEKDKIQNLIFISRKFNEVLSDKKLLDYPALLIAALEKLSGNNAKEEKKPYHYAVPQNCEMKELERSFFEKLTKGVFYVIKLPQPSGEKPAGFIFTEYSPHETPQDKNIDVTRYTLTGKAEELKEVLRNIKRRNIPLDKVLILYTGREYIQAAYDLFSRYRINATFDAGIPITNSKAYCFLQNILDWYSGGYEVRYLLNMLSSGNIYFKEAVNDNETDESKKITNNFIAGVLERKNIGWGLERYELLKKIDDTGESRNQDFLEKEKKACEMVYNFVKEATENMDLSGRINLKEFCRRILDLVKNYTPVKSEKEASGKACITSTLEILSGISDCYVGVNEAVKHIRALVGDLTFANSNPEPGHIHVAPVEQGVWNNRPYLYIVGLTDDKLKGYDTEDPVLDDSERRVLSEKLPKSTDTWSKNVYRLREALLNERESIMCTCSAFDTVALREESTTLSIKGINLKEKNPEEITRDSALNLDEMRAVTLPGVSDEEEKPANTSEPDNIMPENSAGETRHDEPGETGLTGNTSDDESDTVCLEQVFSATALEDYARCPRYYLYRHVLKLRKEDYKVQKEEGWLTSLEEGNLYHGILREIYEHRLNDLLDNMDKVKEVVSEIVEKFADDARTKIPCPGDVIFSSWEKDAVEYLARYIKKDLERLKNEKLTPCGFEFTFREDGSAGCFDNSEIDTSPVEVKIGGYKIKLVGAIDRIDRDNEGNFEIIDYKSGRSATYYKKSKNEKSLDTDKHFQHYLYSLALEKILERAERGSSRVTRARYEFIKEPEQAGPVEQNDGFRNDMAGKIEALLERLVYDTNCLRFAKCTELMEKNEDVSDTERKNVLHYCMNTCEYNVICEVNSKEEVNEA